MTSVDTAAAKPNFFLRRSVVFWIFFLSINILNLQSILAHRINVWNIFYYGFSHLVDHKNLYLEYPAEYWDLYLYSPSFAVLFAPFSKLPYYVGYFLWNNLSMMIIPFLVFKIPRLDDKKKCLVCYIVLIEFLTCLQGTQTNAMIAGLLLAIFLAFEKRIYWLAAFLIAICFYVKIFPIVAASLFLLYPGKLRFTGWFIVAMLTIGALPLLFISPSELVWQYENWKTCLISDQHVNFGTSVPGLIGANFGITDRGKVIVQLIGIAIFFIMYVRRNLFSAYFYRLYFFCAMMIWMPLFNHVSEIYSYAIGIIGVGIWYACQPKSKWLNRGMLLFILLASISPIDPMPKDWSYFVRQHNLKVIPYLFMFIVIVKQMLTKEKAFFVRDQDTSSV